MKKLTLYLFSFLCLLLFVISQSKSFMEWWADYRLNKLHLPFTRAKYGDLYSGCFLPQFMDTATHKLTTYRSSRNKIDLYILHDSYLEGKVKKENFIGVDKLIMSNMSGNGVPVKLDKTKKNILILECSERTADWRLTDTATSFHKFIFGAKDSMALKKEKTPFINYFFNPFINYNIEFNLFDYEFLRPIKETKAKLNYALFERVPKDIVVSTDKQYLFLGETVDPSRIESSFRPITFEQTDFIAKRMNITRNYFRRKGFSEVYFAIIPNPVSILDRERMNYNYKLFYIEFSSYSKFKSIDVYGLFKNSGKKVYRRDDSHWNSTGLQMWVNEVNSRLITY